jgi:hypothetical protein
VVDVGGRHGELCGGEKGRWSGCEEARFADHEAIVSAASFYNDLVAK